MSLSTYIPRYDHCFEGARHEVFNETIRDEVLEVVGTFIDGVLG